jgi:iodotyrosine deiodinase
VNESVGIATGFLIAALHDAGLATLTHTPNPMKFLNDICKRPVNEKPVMVLAVGHPAPDAKVPTHATIKKPLEQICSWL